MLYWEKVSPSFVGKGGFAPVMRLSGAVGLTGAFIFAYSRSSGTCKGEPYLSVLGLYADTVAI